MRAAITARLAVALALVTPALAGLALSSLPASLAAQQPSAEVRLREQREALDRLRRERQQLQTQRQQLQSQVTDLTAEVRNLERQTDVAEQLVRSLDTQLEVIDSEVGSTTAELVRAEDELALKRAVLQRRLVDIYKRGPLFSFQALLSAGTFGELVARYKYLHLVAQRDRELVVRVEELRNRIDRQRNNLVTYQLSLEETRAERAREEQRYRDLQSERRVSLTRVRRTAQMTEERLARIQRDEQRLTNVLAQLERSRVAAERARPTEAPSRSTIRTTDLGRLDWPVDGEIIYRFGRVVNPNNTATRWNGVGIGASEGTPVKAVASGSVVVSEPFGTYGLTVIVQHGGGDYSVYGSLSRIATTRGTTISKGDIVGYVGIADPDLGPHLHFEMRPQGRAVDPEEWLRNRR